MKNEQLEARALVMSFSLIVKDFELAKQCALICVNEKDLIYQRLTPKDDPYCFLLELELLEEVKQEIKKL